MVPSVTVTVVRDRCVGVASPTVLEYARRLARYANVQLLSVQFRLAQGSPTLIGAHLWPDLASEEIAAAILEYFDRPDPPHPTYVLPNIVPWRRA
jgi:hypothetical protein